MIRGEFIDGRPRVRGLVAITYVNDSGRLITAHAELRFLLDTGADRTLICLADADHRLRLPLSAAPLLPEPMTGLGGQIHVHGAAGELRLLDDNGILLSLALTFLIPAPPSGQQSLDFSLLGADVWGLGIVTIDRPGGRVLLEFPAATTTP